MRRIPPSRKLKKPSRRKRHLHHRKMAHRMDRRLLQKDPPPNLHTEVVLVETRCLDGFRHLILDRGHLLSCPH
ncbi:50S ribosomal protein L35 domain protein [Ostertagia ostertagi]